MSNFTTVPWSSVSPSWDDELEWFDQMQIARLVCLCVYALVLAAYIYLFTWKYLTSLEYPRIAVDALRDEQDRLVLRATMGQEAELEPLSGDQWQLTEKYVNGDRSYFERTLTWMVNLARRYPYFWHDHSTSVEDGHKNAVDLTGRSLEPEQIQDMEKVAAHSKAYTVAKRSWVVCGYLVASWSGQLIFVLTGVKTVAALEVDYIRARSGWFDAAVNVEVWSSKWDLASMVLYYVAAGVILLEALLLFVRKRPSIWRFCTLIIVSLLCAQTARLIEQLRTVITWYQITLSAMGYVGIFIVAVVLIVNVRPADALWKHYKKTLIAITGQALHKAYQYSPTHALGTTVARSKLSSAILLLGLGLFLFPYVAHGATQAVAYHAPPSVIMNLQTRQSIVLYTGDTWTDELTFYQHPDRIVVSYQWSGSCYRYIINDVAVDFCEGGCVAAMCLAPSTPTTTSSPTLSTLTSKTSTTTTALTPSTTTSVNMTWILEQCVSCPVQDHIAPVVNSRTHVAAPKIIEPIPEEVPSPPLRSFEVTQYNIHAGHTEVWGVQHVASMQPLLEAITQLTGGMTNATLLWVDGVFAKSQFLTQGYAHRPTNQICFNYTGFYCLDAAAFQIKEVTLPAEQITGLTIRHAPHATRVSVTGALENITMYAARFYDGHFTDTIYFPLAFWPLFKLGAPLISEKEYDSHWCDAVPDEFQKTCGITNISIPYGCIICINSGQPALDLSAYKDSLKKLGVNVADLADVTTGLTAATEQLAEILIKAVDRMQQQLNVLTARVDWLIYAVRMNLIDTTEVLSILTQIQAVEAQLIAVIAKLGELTYYAQARANASLPLVQDILPHLGNTAAQSHAKLLGYDKFEYTYGAIYFTSDSKLVFTQYYKFSDSSAAATTRDITLEHAFPVGGNCTDMKLPMRLYADLQANAYMLEATDVLDNYFCETVPCKRVAPAWHQLTPQLRTWLTNIPNEKSIANIPLPHWFDATYRPCDSEIADIYYSTTTSTLHVYTLADCTVNTRGTTKGHAYTFSTQAYTQASYNITYPARAQVVCPNMQVTVPLQPYAQENSAIIVQTYPTFPDPEDDVIKKKFIPSPTVPPPTIPPQWHKQVDNLANRSKEIETKQKEDNTEMENLRTHTWIGYGLSGFLLIVIIIVACCLKRAKPL